MLYTSSSGSTASRHEQLLQLRILHLGLLQDGNIEVGVFPEREKILVCSSGPRLVSLQGVSTGEAETGQRTPGKVGHQSPVVEELPKLRCRCVAVVQHKVGFSPQVNREQGAGYLHWQAQLDRGRYPQ